MSRLIDANEYKRLIDEQLRFYQPKESSPFHNKILELQREILDSMPTIPAIPVEWLMQRQDEAYRAVYYCGGNVEKNAEIMGAIRTVLELWQKEQEGQK